MDVHPCFTHNQCTTYVLRWDRVQSRSTIAGGWLYHFFINKNVAITTAERHFLSRDILKTFSKIKHVCMVLKTSTNMVVYTNKYVFAQVTFGTFSSFVWKLEQILYGKVTLVKIHWQIVLNKFLCSVWTQTLNYSLFDKYSLPKKHCSWELSFIGQICNIRCLKQLKEQIAHRKLLGKACSRGKRKKKYILSFSYCIPYFFFFFFHQNLQCIEKSLYFYASRIGNIRETNRSSQNDNL